ncbi:MAG: hypothetical protein AB7E80_00500 [Hyphomicrobiaceae bacterium]
MRHVPLAAKLAASSLAVAFLAIAAPQPAAAYQCKHINAMAAGGAKLTQAVAQSSAKAAWVAMVKSNHGMQWSVWSIAKNPSVPCSKSGSKWTCTAKAKPCKYVVF